MDARGFTNVEAMTHLIGAESRRSWLSSHNALPILQKQRLPIPPCSSQRGRIAELSLYGERLSPLSHDRVT